MGNEIVGDCSIVDFKCGRLLPRTGGKCKQTTILYSVAGDRAAVHGEAVALTSDDYHSTLFYGVVADFAPILHGNTAVCTEPKYGRGSSQRVVVDFCSVTKDNSSTVIVPDEHAS